jgi:hypothetical protein
MPRSQPDKGQPLTVRLTTADYVKLKDYCLEVFKQTGIHTTHRAVVTEALRALFAGKPAKVRS